jgi:hypothetical protein
MIEVSDANQLLCRIGLQLMRLSFRQLDSLRTSITRDTDGWGELPQQVLSGAMVRVYVLIDRWGLLFPRISVEVVLGSDCNCIPSGVIPCLYFERFKTGKLRPSVSQVKAMFDRLSRIQMSEQRGKSSLS